MNALFADGFNVTHMLTAGLIAAGIAIAVAFGRFYRARREQIHSAPQGSGTAGASQSLTWTMVGIVVFCLALIFAAVIWRSLAQ